MTSYSKSKVCYFCNTTNNLDPDEHHWHGKILCESCNGKLIDLNMRYAYEVAIG